MEDPREEELWFKANQNEVQEIRQGCGCSNWSYNGALTNTTPPPCKKYDDVFNEWKQEMYKKHGWDEFTCLALLAVFAQTFGSKEDK